jgi:hypothetical protein
MGEWLEGWKISVASGVPTLLSADDWLPKLQALEASLMVAAQNTPSKRLVSQALEKISRNLVRLRWYQIWQQEWRDKPFPTVREYVAASFQTNGGPHYVTPAELEACEALKKIGPEFAILGIENNISPCEQNLAYALDLGNKHFVHWKLVLRSTISSPWIAGRMEICTPASDKFGEFCDAINHLQHHVATPGP